MNLDRRNFVKLSLGAAGTLCFPLASSLARAAGPAPEPHFFFQVIFQTGLDPTYLFDARPLAMTQAGIIQNYLGTEPQEWQGANGTKSWATSLVDPLKPYRDRFSVLNGVIMATSFDGHDQNMNFLLTGDPFGGESFVPHLNRMAVSQPAAPLDAVSAGFLLANLTNSGSSVPLSHDSALKLLGRLKSAAPTAASNPLFAFMQGRMSAIGAGAGAFSLGARAMGQAYAQVPDFASMLAGLKPEPSAPPSPLPQGGGPGQSGVIDPQFVDLSLQLFKLGVTRSAVFISTAGFDAHDPKTAAMQPKTIGSAAETLATVFKMLASTPFDGTRSFLDVTTVMAASEFGRTLRQKDHPIDATGTDHNPLSNTIILGGKGIKGGLLLGESDTRAAGETLSKVHSAFDPAGLKMMGKPFDFATGRARADLPTNYNPADYLGMASVANTIYSLFGVSKSQYRKLGRNLGEAPVVGQVL